MGCGNEPPFYHFTYFGSSVILSSGIYVVSWLLLAIAISNLNSTLLERGFRDVSNCELMLPHNKMTAFLISCSHVIGFSAVVAIGKISRESTIHNTRCDITTAGPSQHPPTRTHIYATSIRCVHKDTPFSFSNRCPYVCVSHKTLTTSRSKRKSRILSWTFSLFIYQHTQSFF